MFVKVFDESRGYYGNQGHVARFERDLDNRGQYEAFKEAYERIAGRDWTQGREEGVLEEPNVAKAFAEVNGQSEARRPTSSRKYQQRRTRSRSRTSPTRSRRGSTSSPTASGSTSSSTRSASSSAPTRT